MGNKTLIAIVSARHRKEWRDAIRKTWLPLVPKDKADALFFVGRGEPLQEDIIELDCDDSYQGLPEKIRSIIKWAHKHEYEFMLKNDDDVVLKPVELLTSGYEQHQYSGRANRMPNENTPYTVPVGFNYWLSKKCMSILADAEIPKDWDNDDERWVAKILQENGIGLVDDRRYGIYCGDEIVQRPLRPYRPLAPPPPPRITSEEFSWTVFLEANSGTGIPLDKKIAEFYKLFNKLHKTL